jgi:tRNA threonylcarbamoyladenosine biosynthesis protein TsaB
VTSDRGAGPTLLAIETAGSACSAAVGRGPVVLAAERQAMRYGHAEALLPMIDRVVAAGGVSRAALDGIAVAVGPGGFTGIRVGLGAAQGIALALKARLIGVTSFAAAAALLPAGPGAALVALDSRRDDLYVQLFNRSSGLALSEPVAVLAGRFDTEIAAESAPDARGVLAAALRQIKREPAESPVRPLYLRPPDVTMPKQHTPLAAARR